jgi:RNA polymerase sigma-70 factor, ECF subfamily
VLRAQIWPKRVRRAERPRGEDHSVAFIQPDEGLVRAAQRGDENAFAKLMRDYELPIFNYVLHSVGNYHQAEDLTQDIFLRALRSLPGFSFRSKFTTWLFAIAKNRILDELRTNGRRPSTVDLDDAGPFAVRGLSPDQQAEMGDLWSAIETLEPELKSPLLLRDVVGLRYQEIAETLEISLPNVRWRIYVARRRVQLALGHGDADAAPASRKPAAAAR